MKILLISKPLCPPWHDSGKNWARDVATYASGEGFQHHVLVPSGHEGWSGVEGVVVEPIYAGGGRYSPRLLDNVRAMRRLVERCPCDAVHFCFAPNRRTSGLARLAMRWRKQPSIHTILSVPARFEEARSMIFADRVVCVSRSTADRLSEIGVRGVEVVLAGIPVEAPLREGGGERLREAAAALGVEGGRPVVLFPGDYEFSQAADVFAGAVERLWRETEAVFVFACRIKRAASLERERAIQARLAEPFRAGRVRFLREVGDMRALLALSRAVALPAESTFAKMDLPVVILEAMAEGVPVALADVAPLREVLGQEQEGGALVPPLDPGALAEALRPWVLDEEAARQVGSAGRARVIRRHDAAVNCRIYRDIYSSL